jgi:hypothetical protein
MTGKQWSLMAGACALIWGDWIITEILIRFWT